MLEIELTAAGRSFVLRVPTVAQSGLLAGLESLNRSELQTVAQGLRLQVKILDAQELPPRLLLSPEVNEPGSGTAAHDDDLRPGRVSLPARAAPGRSYDKERNRRAGRPA